MALNYRKAVWRLTFVVIAGWEVVALPKLAWVIWNWLDNPIWRFDPFGHPGVVTISVVEWMALAVLPPLGLVCLGRIAGWVIEGFNLD